MINKITFVSAHTATHKRYHTLINWKSHLDQPTSTMSATLAPTQETMSARDLLNAISALGKKEDTPFFVPKAHASGVTHGNYKVPYTQVTLEFPDAFAVPILRSLFASLSTLEQPSVPELDSLTRALLATCKDLTEIHNTPALAPVSEYLALQTLNDIKVSNSNIATAPSKAAPSNGATFACAASKATPAPASAPTPAPSSTPASSSSNDNEEYVGCEMVVCAGKRFCCGNRVLIKDAISFEDGSARCWTCHSKPQRTVCCGHCLHENRLTKMHPLGDGFYTLVRCGFTLCPNHLKKHNRECTSNWCKPSATN